MLIDADALIEYIDVGHLRNPLELCFSERAVVDMLERRPTVDAVPVVHGRWIEDTYSNSTYDADCSVCGEKINWNGCMYDFNYCPNCGAKMDRSET